MVVFVLIPLIGSLYYDNSLDFLSGTAFGQAEEEEDDVQPRAGQKLGLSEKNNGAHVNGAAKIRDDGQHGDGAIRPPSGEHVMRMAVPVQTMRPSAPSQTMRPTAPAQSMRPAVPAQTTGPAEIPWDTGGNENVVHP